MVIDEIGHFYKAERTGGANSVQEIIDIHSHILPGLDDGSSTMKETMRMLKAASAQGITRIIATPHYSRHFQNDDPRKIHALTGKVREAAASHDIPVKIYPGQEIFYSEDIWKLLRQGKLLTLADSRYVMLEFYPYEPYLTICRAVQEAVREGYRPVLAHLERYEALDTRDKIDSLRKQGACTQMNFRSAGGSLFDARTRRCRKLLREGCVDFLGTDMHNMHSRPLQTEDTVRWMESRLGTSAVRKLLSRNPRKLLADEKLRK